MGPHSAGRSPSAALDTLLAIVRFAFYVTHTRRTAQAKPPTKSDGGHISKQTTQRKGAMEGSTESGSDSRSTSSLPARAACQACTSPCQGASSGRRGRRWRQPLLGALVATRKRALVQQLLHLGRTCRHHAPLGGNPCTAQHSGPATLWAYVRLCCAPVTHTPTGCRCCSCSRTLFRSPGYTSLKKTGYWGI